VIECVSGARRDPLVVDAAANTIKIRRLHRGGGGPSGGRQRKPWHLWVRFAYNPTRSPPLVLGSPSFAPVSVYLYPRSHPCLASRVVRLGELNYYQ
jgi:hypothetical protein